MFIQKLTTNIGFLAEKEPTPEGYNEALKDHTAFATNLLSMALTGEIIKRCWDCLSWIGRCKKGHLNRIARDEACDEFSSKIIKVNNNAGS